jgi:hypothetical protein
MTKRKSHGGERENAGRPTEADTPTSRINVTLDEKTAEILRGIGGGNLSAGIREAARRISACKLTC